MRILKLIIVGGWDNGKFIQSNQLKRGNKSALIGLISFRETDKVTVD